MSDCSRCGLPLPRERAEPLSLDLLGVDWVDGMDAMARAAAERHEERCRRGICRCCPAEAP